MKREAINECPICGSMIQSTRIAYMENVVLSWDGMDVVTEGIFNGYDDDRREVYCRNDHTQEQMTDRLEVCTRDELKQQLECCIEQDCPESEAHIEAVLEGLAEPDDWLIENIAEERLASSQAADK